MPIRVVLERGPKAKKVVAFAVDWPGWSRGAKTAEGALETLAAYRERYRPVAVRAGLEREFDAAGPLEIVEDRVGPGSTDFWGISFSPSSPEQEPMDEAELERKLTVLQACWAYFDDVAARVSPEMRKGPRGGGRDRDTIIRHTIRVESEDFAKKVGLVVPEYGGARTRRPGALPVGLRRRRCAPTSAARSSGRCGRGRWPFSSAIPPSTRWTTRGRWRTRTCPARGATWPPADRPAQNFLPWYTDQILAKSWGMSVTTDYYAALGVRRDANADEIKMAYRRLARELHPDVNPDPVSQERFKEITQAHEVLSDPDKRQMYDLGGDPFAATGGYFGQAWREPSKRDGYPRGRWESDRERWPPHPSGGAWNQSWDQAPYSAYLGGQPPSASYDWRPPPAVRPHRPRPIFEAVALMCVVLAVTVLVAARVVAHRSSNPGPLSHQFQGGTECLALAGHQVVTYGLEWVRNPGTAPAVIDDMTLAEPEGLRLVAAWVVPTSGLLYGAQVGYPPSKMPLPGWQWTSREPPNGANVPNTPGKHDRMNLLFVVGLEPGVTRGQAAGIDIWYHVGSSSYHLRTAKRLVVGVGEAGIC